MLIRSTTQVLFGSPLSVDAISCMVFRFGPSRTGWAKYFSLARDGAFLGVTQFSGQDKMLIQFDISSQTSEGQYIEINISQTVPSFNYLAS